MEVSQKYKEIFKLKKMLEDAEIPFYFKEGLGYLEELYRIFPDLCEHYQICYPSEKDRWISVIEGFGTLGGDHDKLEIMGGLTPLESHRCCVEEQDEIIGRTYRKKCIR